MDNASFDDSDNPYSASFKPDTEPKPRGCFFYGCIIALVLGVIGLIGLGAATYTLYHFYTNAIKEYTSTTPVPIPQVKIPDDQRKELDARIDAFQKALDKGEAAELVLTADEINTRIAQNDTLKGKIYVTIQDDKVSGQLSLPLSETPLPLVAGRYFNGSATLRVSLRNGQLVVHATDIEVNGKKMPPDMARQFATQNLAKDATNNPDAAEAIRKLQSIRVRGGKVYIKSRSKVDRDSEGDDDGGSPAADEPKTKTPAPGADPRKDVTPGEKPSDEPPGHAPRPVDGPKDGPKAA